MHKEGEEGCGLTHGFKYPVHVEIQFEDSVDALHAKQFCDPIIGWLQAITYAKNRRIFKVHGVSLILQFFVSESSLSKPFTWFRCISCDEQHDYSRVQMRVRGMDQESCANARAMLAAQADKDRKKKPDKNGFKEPLGSARKRKSAEV